MQNGALTAVWAIVDLILFLTIVSRIALARGLNLCCGTVDHRTPECTSLLGRELSANTRHLLTRYPKSRHLALNLPLAKLYTNSLLSTLNSRAGWGFDGSDRSEEALKMQRVQMRVRLSRASCDALSLLTLANRGLDTRCTVQSNARVLIPFRGAQPRPGTHARGTNFIRTLLVNECA